jgi:hypothetical protein
VELTTVGQVIATRSIRYEESKDVAFVVKIGLPQPFRDGGDFYCPVQITPSPGDDLPVSYSVGIDSVQALQLALKNAGGILFGINERCGGKLRWDGDENGDLAFPSRYSLGALTRAENRKTRQPRNPT